MSGHALCDLPENDDVLSFFPAPRKRCRSNAGLAVPDKRACCVERDLADSGIKSHSRSRYRSLKRRALPRPSDSTTHQVCFHVPSILPTNLFSVKTPVWDDDDEIEIPRGRSRNKAKRDASRRTSQANPTCGGPELATKVGKPVISAPAGDPPHTFSILYGIIADVLGAAGSIPTNMGADTSAGANVMFEQRRLDQACSSPPGPGM